MRVTKVTYKITMHGLTLNTYCFIIILNYSKNHKIETVSQLIWNPVIFFINEAKDYVICELYVGIILYFTFSITVLDASEMWEATLCLIKRCELWTADITKGKVRRLDGATVAATLLPAATLIKPYSTRLMRVLNLIYYRSLILKLNVIDGKPPQTYAVV